MRKITKLVGSGVAGLAVAAGTFAFAQFTLGSQGDATGNVATPSNPSVSGTITDALWPGDCSDVKVTFTNPSDNKHPVDIINVNMTSVDTANSNVSPDFLKVNLAAGGNPGAASLSASNGWVVQPGASTDVTIKGGVCLSPDAGNAGDPRGSVAGGEDIAVKVNIASKVEAGTAYAANAKYLG